eukprot:CAMPEP_0116023728 /NCGR_PEP_ID=MMETSP0321-20121206/11809_1 /TAXON_ID=163516 /ORGANISM="Leptocylindrus danicus var. danicus, Strain B650" /LENGTH=151 /DNA_ID=CAMNT_0003495153 /DNA_START=555 /DNA_END=1010 /DNA_ORIENTATION=+
MERRVLMTNLVDRAQKWILNDDQDKLRVGCFERTELLLTWQQNLEKDKLVRPQGMTAPFRIPTRTPDNFQELPESAEIEDVNEADVNSDDDDEEQHMLDDVEVDDMEVLMEDEDDSDENEEEEESEDMNVEMTRSSRGRVITARHRFGVEG